MKGHICILFLSLFITQDILGQSRDFLQCDSILSRSTLSFEDLELLDTILFSMNYYQSDSVKVLYERAIKQAASNDFTEFSIRFQIWLADLLYENFQPDSGLY